MTSTKKVLSRFAVAAVLALALVGISPPAGPTQAQAQGQANFDAFPPITCVNVFNQAVNANTNVVSTDLTPGKTTIAYRVTVVLSATDSVLEVQVKSGGTTVEADMNSATALTAGNLYTFVFGAHSDYTYNFHFETGCTIGLLLVDEVRAGAF